MVLMSANEIRRSEIKDLPTPAIKIAHFKKCFTQGTVIILYFGKRCGKRFKFDNNNI